MTCAGTSSREPVPASSRKFPSRELPFFSQGNRFPWFPAPVLCRFPPYVVGGNRNWKPGSRHTLTYTVASRTPEAA